MCTMNTSGQASQFVGHVHPQAFVGGSGVKSGSVWFSQSPVQHPSSSVNLYHFIVMVEPATVQSSHPVESPRPVYGTHAFVGPVTVQEPDGAVHVAVHVHRQAQHRLVARVHIGPVPFQNGWPVTGSNHKLTVYAPVQGTYSAKLTMSTSDPAVRSSSTPFSQRSVHVS